MCSNVIKSIEQLYNPKSGVLGDLSYCSTFNEGFNNAKYEMLQLCLRSKQNASELLG